MRAAFLGRGAGEHDASLAFAPAAIIEHDDEIAGLRELRGFRAEPFHGATPAIGHDDGRQLSRGRLWRVDVGAEPAAVAQDRCLAQADVIGRRK